MAQNAHDGAQPAWSFHEAESVWDLHVKHASEVLWGRFFVSVSPNNSSSVGFSALVLREFKSRYSVSGRRLCFEIVNASSQFLLPSVEGFLDIATAPDGRFALFLGGNMDPRDEISQGSLEAPGRATRIVIVWGNLFGSYSPGWTASLSSPHTSNCLAGTGSTTTTADQIRLEPNPPTDQAAILSGMSDPNDRGGRTDCLLWDPSVVETVLPAGSRLGTGVFGSPLFDPVSSRFVAFTLHYEEPEMNIDNTNRRYYYNSSWGEDLDDFRHGRVFIADQITREVREVAPKFYFDGNNSLNFRAFSDSNHVSLGQICWLPDRGGFAATVWPERPYRLGLKACQNRPSWVFVFRFNAPLEISFRSSDLQSNTTTREKITCSGWPVKFPTLDISLQHQQAEEPTIRLKTGYSLHSPFLLKPPAGSTNVTDALGCCIISPRNQNMHWAPVIVALVEDTSGQFASKSNCYPITPFRASFDVCRSRVPIFPLMCYCLGSDGKRQVVPVIITVEVLNCSSLPPSAESVVAPRLLPVVTFPTYHHAGHGGESRLLVDLLLTGNSAPDPAYKIDLSTISISIIDAIEEHPPGLHFSSPLTEELQSRLLFLVSTPKTSPTACVGQLKINRQQQRAVIQVSVESLDPFSRWTLTQHFPQLFSPPPTQMKSPSVSCHWKWLNNRHLLVEPSSETLKTSSHYKPYVVWLHGGPHSVSLPRFSLPVRFLVALGFSVLAVNYRGSLGFGEEEQQQLPGHAGILDVSDCYQATMELLREIRGDNTRSSDTGEEELPLFIAGASHGGFLALHLVCKYRNLFRAAAVINPVANLVANLAASDIPDWNLAVATGRSTTSDTDKVPSLSGNDVAGLFERSPIAHVAGVRARVLMGLGGMDRRVPAFQGLDFYKQLCALDEQRGVLEDRHRVLWFSKCGHSLDNVESQRVFWLETVRWFSSSLSHQ